MSKGGRSDVILECGVREHRGKAIGGLSNSYLSWLLRQDWFERESEFEDVQDEMDWRRENRVYVDD
jgi:hypothetical protein